MYPGGTPRSTEHHRFDAAAFAAGGSPCAARCGTALAKLKRFPAITHAGAVRCVLRSLSRFAFGQNWTRSVSHGPGHLIQAPRAEIEAQSSDLTCSYAASLRYAARGVMAGGLAATSNDEQVRLRSRASSVCDALRRQHRVGDLPHRDRPRRRPQGVQRWPGARMECVSRLCKDRERSGHGR
jgi:hypothetical protein